ncbi:MAG: 2'-5' RNA ligase family protein [Aestuariibacter sp.]
MIQCIYDQMWQRFELASVHNDYELDLHLLDVANDTRRGITALAYLKQGNSLVLDEIISFQKAVREVEPNQYYHPLDELHLTILSVISCVPDFELNEISIQTYADIFLSVLSSMQPIEIKYRGVSASPNCIVLQGFPTNDSLEQFRNKLRTQLRDAGLRISFDSRYKLVTAHSSLIRFKTPIIDGQQLFKLCQQYRNHDFGSIVLKNCELVFNNWYQNLVVTKSLASSSVVDQPRV